MELVRRVGGNVAGLARPGSRVHAPESKRHLTFQQNERFLEIVTVRRRTASWWDVHVDHAEPSGGIVTAQKDRVGVSSDADVAQALILPRPNDCKSALRSSAGIVEAAEILGPAFIVLLL